MIKMREAVVAASRSFYLYKKDGDSMNNWSINQEVNRRSIELDISAATIDQVEDSILEASKKVIENNIQPDWNRLQSKAREFLEQDKFLSGSIYETQNNFKRIAKAINPGRGKSLFSKYADRKEEISASAFNRAKWLLAVNFEKELDIFRKKNTKRKMAFVHSDEDNGKQILSSYELSIEDLILNSNKFNKINDTNLLTKLKGEMDAKIIEKQINQEVVDAGQNIYNEVQERLLEFQKKYGHKSAILKKKRLLMWYIENQWYVGSILNEGDQKEAYLSFILKENKTNEYKNYMHNKDKFVEYYYDNYLHEVGNDRAIMGEDVVLEGDNLEFGSKGDNAGLPSYNQYIEIAKWIALQEMPFSTETLNEKLKNDPKYGQDVKRNIKHAIKAKTEKDIIKELEEYYS